MENVGMKFRCTGYIYDYSHTPESNRGYFSPWGRPDELSKWAK